MAIVGTIDIFDLSTRQWSQGADLVKQRSYHQAAVIGGKICVAGGFGGAASIDEAQVLGSVEVFDPVADVCDTVAPLRQPRVNFAAAAAGGSMCVFGGMGSLVAVDNILTTVEIFAPPAAPSLIGAMLGQARHSAQAVSSGNRLYILGGSVDKGTGSNATNSVLIYYP
jgi:N-acetylneuraminic acid mutarotase